MRSGRNEVETRSHQETGSQGEIAVRTTFSLLREHLLRLLHSEPHAVSSCFGPVGQSAKAVAAKARVARMVKSCTMAAGGSRVWGLKEIVCLGVVR